MGAHSEEALRDLVERQVFELGALGRKPSQGYGLRENPQAIEHEEGGQYIVDDHESALKVGDLRRLEPRYPLSIRVSQLQEESADVIRKTSGPRGGDADEYCEPGPHEKAAGVETRGGHRLRS